MMKTSKVVPSMLSSKSLLEDQPAVGGTTLENPAEREHCTTATGKTIEKPEAKRGGAASGNQRSGVLSTEDALKMLHDSLGQVQIVTAQNAGETPFASTRMYVSLYLHCEPLTLNKKC